MTLHRKFKFTPSAIITDRLGTYSGLSQAREFAAYQWFVARLNEYNNRHGGEYDRWEYLNGTSSIRNSEPYAIHGFDEPSRRLAMLFAHVGMDDSDRGTFLWSCNLRNWADLSKPFIIPVTHTDKFPDRTWFELRGRTFKISPNPSHPPATWVQSGAVQVNRAGTLWRLRVEYGYVRDSSSWHHDISQKTGESLETFTDRANAELDDLLTPEDKWIFTGPHRLARERDWQESYKALRSLFWDGHSLGDWERRIADTLAEVPGSSLTAQRIDLTAGRLKTIERWIESTKRKRKALGEES